MREKGTHGVPEGYVNMREMCLRLGGVVRPYADLSKLGDCPAHSNLERRASGIERKLRRG